jgi:septal ring factor EnvC (AmiA/AmiB activator)
MALAASFAAVAFTIASGIIVQIQQGNDTEATAVLAADLAAVKAEMPVLQTAAAENRVDIAGVEDRLNEVIKKLNRIDAKAGELEAKVDALTRNIDDLLEQLRMILTGAP